MMGPTQVMESPCGCVIVKTVTHLYNVHKVDRLCKKHREIVQHNQEEMRRIAEEEDEPWQHLD